MTKQLSANAFEIGTIVTYGKSFLIVTLDEVSLDYRFMWLITSRPLVTGQILPASMKISSEDRVVGDLKTIAREIAFKLKLKD